MSYIGNINMMTFYKKKLRLGFNVRKARAQSLMVGSIN